MTALEKLDQVIEKAQTTPLSTVVPLVFPIALECSDYFGYSLLAHWQCPLCESDKANAVQRNEIIKVLMLQGLSREKAKEIELSATHQYIDMKTIEGKGMLAHSVKEMETWLVEADKSIKNAPIHDDKVKEVITRKRQIEQQYELLRSYITSKLTYYRQLLSKEYNVTPKSVTINNFEGKAEFSKVFIVHGHNGEIKEAVARLIERQGIQAIILHEQANQGATIIEKFEKNSNVGGAVCLFTADDLGHAKSNPKEMYRARQNVVFETGYFIGKLGRDKVVLVADKGVEIPSDLQGVVYTEAANWQFSILRELKTIGYNIDYNKLG